MTPYGFVEVADGPDPYLRDVLEMACRLSHGRRVVLRLDHGVRPRMEAMMRALPAAGVPSRIELLDRTDRQAAIPAVRAAGFCVFSDADMARYVGKDQVGVYSIARGA